MSTDSTQMGDEVTIALIRDGEYILSAQAVAKATDTDSEETDNEE